MSSGAVSAVLVQGGPGVEVGVAVVLGVGSALLAFRKLQCVRGRGRNLWLLVLALSFVMCAYGLGLLLELAAEGCDGSQISAPAIFGEGRPGKKAVKREAGVIPA